MLRLSLAFGCGCAYLLVACVGVTELDDFAYDPRGGGPSTAADGGGGGNGGHGGDTGAESCFNGFDDNGDGKTDCADPLCGDTVCAPAPPPPWEGPITVFEADAIDDLPDCSAAWPTSSDRQLIHAEHPGCSPCECGDPTVTCQAEVTVVVSTIPFCVPSTTVNPVTVTTSCMSLGDACTNNPCIVAVSGSATCTPSGGKVQVRDPVVGHLRICAGVAGDGCGSDRCIPHDDGGAVCVWREGAHDCPPGYPTARQAFTGFTDGTGCEPCSCSHQQEELPCVLSSYQEDDCSDNPSNRAGCTYLNHVRARLRDGAAVDACASTGGDPTGSVEPVDPLTVCCQ